LQGKAYEDSDYTIVIAVVHWLKRITIMQKLTSLVKLWALLPSRRSPLLVDCSCDVTYICAHWQEQWCSETL